MLGLGLGTWHVMQCMLGLGLGLGTWHVMQCVLHVFIDDVSVLCSRVRVRSIMGIGVGSH